jgi:Arc/MetJ-type ribon-helix-helix transcriptional regulator
MENLSLKLESPMAKHMEKCMLQFNYSTKTEFVREAIRDKLQELDKESERKRAWAALYAARGIFKGQGKARTDEEFRKLREEAGEKFLAELEKKFNQK